MIKCTAQRLIDRHLGEHLYDKGPYERVIHYGIDGKLEDIWNDARVIKKSFGFYDNAYPGSGVGKGANGRFFTFADGSSLYFCNSGGCWFKNPPSEEEKQRQAELLEKSRIPPLRQEPPTRVYEKLIRDGYDKHPENHSPYKMIRWIIYMMLFWAGVMVLLHLS